ncbi:MAG: ester cyclase [Solirubrobacteraceae bacterium]
MSAALSPTAELRARREAIVREHMESENHHDFDTTIGTFSHPRYEIVPTGDVYDGEAAVRAYFAETRGAFPDQRNELVSLRHADDAVIVEFDLLGTHLGPLRSLPPTGRSFRARVTAFFIFDEERIVCERVYFDQLTIMRQLGVAHDPASLAGRVSTLISHPLTIGRALIAARRGRRPERS